MPTSERNSIGTREQRTLVLLLAGVAGAVDAIGYVTLFHLFTANMTGNTQDMIGGAVAGHVGYVLEHAFPIVMFVVGAMLGAVIARALKSHVVALLVETAALVLFTVAAWNRSTRVPSLTAALPALAMGLQAVTFRKCGEATVQTTYITGMLVAFADAVVSSITSNSPTEAARARLLFAIWSCYCCGALGGFLSHARIGSASAFFPLAGLVAAIAVSGPAPRARGESAARA